jgi:RimJ/RimL family protein N-acetyltransferase
MNIPVLETERLVLRGFQPGDLDAMHRLYADAEVSAFITFDGKAQDRDYAWRMMSTFLGHWQLRGFGLWALQLKSTQGVVGYAGPWFPEGWPGQEIGWTIGRAFWGNGYATEAARASLDYVFKTLRWPTAIHVINPHNTRSIAVATRLGSVKQGTWNRQGKELLIYGQPNPFTT